MWTCSGFRKRYESFETVGRCVTTTSGNWLKPFIQQRVGALDRGTNLVSLMFVVSLLVAHLVPLLI